MIVIGRKEYGLSNFSIRFLGIVTMAVAGWGFVKGYGYDMYEALGWTSFTFFAFLLAEGIYHTSNKRLYFRRFLLFTAIGETAYTYYRTQTFWTTKFFSAMTTMFLGFLIVFIVSLLKDKFDNMVLDMIVLAGLGYGGYWLANTYHFDFGGYGILIIIGFYIARNVTYTKITQFAVIMYISFFLSTNVLTFVNFGGLQYPISQELFAAAALPFIWLYSDNRGPNAVILQVLQYMAYPIFVGVLILFKYFL